MNGDRTLRRRGAHTMERIDPPDAGLRGWKVYAGDLGEYIGVFRSKTDAKDALDTWHYFHPEEQRARDRAWVSQFTTAIRDALEDGGPDDALRMLAIYEDRWHV